MTLPVSPNAIQFSDVNTELSRTSTAALSFSDTQMRDLADDESAGTAISMSQLHGRSAVILGSLVTDDTNGTSFTRSSMSIGPAQSDRRVFVLLHWAELGTHRTVSSATIGGVTATVRQIGHTGGSTGLGAAIISAIVPSGTTADFAVTFSGATQGISTYFVVANILATSGTVNDFFTDETTVTADDVTGTIDIGNDGLLLAVYTGSTNTNAVAVTWTGVTEVYDTTGPTTTFDGNAIRVSGAVSTFLATQAGRTVTAAIATTVNSGNDLVVESWD